MIILSLSLVWAGSNSSNPFYSPLILGDLNFESFASGAEPPEDTCTYTSGDWNIDCADNCVISSPVDVGGNDIFITGTGTFVTTANITNFGNLFIKGTDSSNKCEVTCIGGCFRQ